MGNYVSCTLSTPLGNSSIKVILPGGEIRQFNAHIKAAELMLETPNFFLVNSQSLKLRRRFSPLNADEDLECGNAYAMFPTNRLNSMVTPGDLGALFLAAKKNFAGKVRILPEAAEDDHLQNEVKMSKPKLNLDDIEEFSTPEFRHRLSMSRSKKPLLETIAEEPFCCR
ncbi:serine/threonine-protein kinase CTR1-like [Hibiscus syriacus]|uniref:Serine/threonine-protein kinase CTR1-like n=1 Tax=Hibiscus syriacus TaxID=106335 RepID=A0A6A2WVW9_HIBSY|nr:uncharacterized protein LOC120190654 [Hibiscus syriacus]KAE8659360.1 serine/threonine-protein kinase CTR1-like [Hibiscus syriacus]